MGSFPVDIDLRFDASSALKLYADFTAKAKALMADLAAGVEGADKKILKLQEDFARQTISTSTRSGRALESQIKSLERQAEMAGKTRSEQLLLRQEKWIKSLGEDEKAIKRVTAAFQQLIKVEKEEESKRGGHGGVLSTGTTANLVFRGTKDIFEGRSTYAIMDFITAGARMQGMGMGAAGAGAAGGGALLAGAATGVTVLAAALGALEVVGLHAAKAMGDYGEHLRELQGVTGGSVREVQILEIAAKTTGHSVEDIAHGMRGFTQALQGTGSTAVKASKDLQRMGVDVVGLREGSIGVVDALEQIGNALQKNPDQFKTNLELMEIFKKSGLNLKLVLKEMGEAKKLAGEVDLFSEDEVRQMDEMDKKFDRLTTKMDNFFKRLKFWAAEAFVAQVDVIVAVKKEVDKYDQGELGERSGRLITEAYRVPRPEAPRPPSSAEANALLQQQGGVLAERRTRYGEFMAGGGAGTRLEREERKLRALEKEANELSEDTAKNQADAVIRADYFAHLEKVTRELTTQKALVEGIRQAEADQKAIVEALRRAGEDAELRKISPFELPAQATLRKALTMRNIKPEQEAKFRDIYGPQITEEQEQQARKFQRQMLDTERAAARSLGRAGMGGIAPVDIGGLGQGGVTRADVERDIVQQEQERRAIALQTFADEYALIEAREVDARDYAAVNQQRRDIVEATGKYLTANREAEMAALKERHALNEKERDLDQKHRETMSRIQLADREEGIKHQAELAEKLAQLRFKSDNPAAGIVASFRISVELSQQLFDLEMERIRLHEKGYKAEEDSAIALHKLHKETATAREEAELKLAQMQMQQLDALKSKIEPLYHTLFTDPKSFGQQLKTTLRDAALKPIEGGLSELTAKALYPTIFGETGTGGIAGSLRSVFGGKGGGLNDLKLTSTGDVPVVVRNFPSLGGTGFGGGGGGLFGGGGGGGGFFGGGGGGGGWPPYTPPFFPSGTYSSGGGDINYSSADPLAGQNYSPSMGSVPTRTTGMYGLDLAKLAYPAIMAEQAGRVNPIAAALGKVGSLFGGSYGGNWPYSHVGDTVGDYGRALTMQGATLGSRIHALSTGPLAGTPLGPLAGTAGMMLAMHGLTGERRGTLGGVAEGAAGGFMVAGPIGAAVGAGIGFGEMIAGVESPRREAKRLVHSLYAISINDTTADKIVGIANQSYGTRVSIAVRAPEVRHMLGLYAAGTGQGGGSAMGVTEAHGASLVEAGGRLQQQASYQYGQAYAYRSSLPIYGGTSTQTLGAPGGGMQLSLNIGGQDAARFMTGHVVTPEVVQSQYASAMYGSAGRVPQALMMAEPGTIAS